MKIYNIVILTALLVLLIDSLCLADKVVLKQGQVLTGDILAEKDKQLIVDIGVTVLSISKEKILRYEYTDTQEPQDVNDSDVEAEVQEQSAGQLYRTANLKKTTIETPITVMNTNANRFNIYLYIFHPSYFML